MRGKRQTLESHLRFLFPQPQYETTRRLKVRKIALMAATAALMVAVGLSLNLGQVNAAGTMPAVGDTAPGFTLPSQTGVQVSLSSFAGKWVVLYFYPKDMTPGCTIEAHNFQQAQAQFEAKNAVILGVSVDSADSHQQFCTKEGLTFRLLADTDHTVVSAYGSLAANGAMASRNTFLIDPQGKIAQEWTSVSPQTTVPIVLAAIPGASAATPSKVVAPEMRKPITDSVKPPPPGNTLPPQQ
jgi:peroxiredoxin Q/BCP